VRGVSEEGKESFNAYGYLEDIVSKFCKILKIMHLQCYIKYAACNDMVLEMQ
jgi:hypothetical protein